VLLSHFVTSPDCIYGMDSPLLGCVERSSPKSRLRRAEGAGLDGECAVRAIIFCRRNVQKSFGAVRGSVDCYCGDLSFHRHE